ncbi:MFS transporter [Mucilaginibacter endophyticus]|uniref:MFS transporter n=1 Tax=Mucilaginibacter endophyticus TaxID=2675003 RepID=UPI000E0CD014|nr:MFS transporter [Mucilaginibacter endophyticus]
MNIRPTKTITEQQLNQGLKHVTADGLSAEAMVVFTSGTFLTALAIHMGASNFQLGLFAALPTFTTIFQLAAIWLVRRFNNRRLITVVFNFLARLPLIAIGIMPMLFSGSTTIAVLLMLLFFQHIFGDIAGASWNAWMKDLIPQEHLGGFFSRRTRMAQTLNVTLSLATAIGLDFIKRHYPAQEITAYTTLFLTGGALGMVSVYLLLRTPEPVAEEMEEKVLPLFWKSLKNTNFRKLLLFNSLWAFSLNLATPFFAVFMMKSLGLPVAYLIGLGILSQLSGILSLNLWGQYSDRFSNKTVIRLCAPLYILCIMAYAFAGLPSSQAVALGILALIHIVSGFATAGINLSLSNIGIKLAPKNEAIVYLSAKNMFVAFFSTIAPLVGGLLADLFANNTVGLNLQLSGSRHLQINLLELQGWNYFFIIGGMLAMLSLRLLTNVKEEGETEKSMVVIHMRSSLKRRLHVPRLKENRRSRNREQVGVDAVKHSA